MRRWSALWEVDVQGNGGLQRLPTEFAISKQDGSGHVYRTSIPDVGNILGAFVRKSFKIEKKFSRNNSGVVNLGCVSVRGESIVC
jgi:hypothetical protein